MIAKCGECDTAIEGETAAELEANVEHHRLWEHPANEDVDETLAALAGAGEYILDLFADGRSVEALMALYELEEVAGRMRHWVEVNLTS